MKKLIAFLDTIVPRFMTEETAVNYSVDSDGNREIYEAVPLHLVYDDETFDAIVTMRFFNCFGWVFGARVVSEFKPFRTTANRGGFDYSNVNKDKK